MERILHNTEGMAVQKCPNTTKGSWYSEPDWLSVLSLGETEEHEDLTRALGLIKDTIVQVDALVNLHEKNSRLRDIRNKLEPKASGKFKDGRVFRREDLTQVRRRLLHEGTVSWKAASGRLKGTVQQPVYLKAPLFYFQA